MKKFSKLALLLLIFVSIFCLSACSEVRVMMVTNDDGTIDEMVYISIDNEEVAKCGYDINTMKLDIRTYAIDEAEKFNTELNIKITADLLISTNPEVKKILNSYIDGIDPIISEWKNNTFMIGVRFKTEEIYRYFYNISDNIKLEPKIEESFWYNKVTYTAYTMYAKHSSLYNRINTRFTLKYKDIPLTESSKLMYTYVTDKRRQHSNADFITRDADKYYHTWIVDRDDTDMTIELYYNIANKDNWIVLAILSTAIISCVITIVGIIIYLIKNKYINKNIKNN